MNLSSCKTCKSNNFAFHNIDNNKLLNTMQIKQNNNSNRHISNSINNSHWCSVCSKILSKPKSGLPCTDCKHKKCSELKQNDILNFHNILLNSWECTNCMQNKFPFSTIENKEIQSSTFNSNLNCKCANKKENVSSSGRFDILVDNTSHKDTWLSQEPETDQLYNEYINLKPNFNYYETHAFHALINKINIPKTFSIFHTNICSLPANMDNLEILFEDLEHEFDVISLSETWNPEGKQHTYTPKILVIMHTQEQLEILPKVVVASI